MRRRVGPLLVLCALLPWPTPRSAEAVRAHMSRVPNGPRYGCVLCHTSTIEVAFNAFGADVRATLLEGRPDWSALYALDSDQDGQTNGQELGDPCGVWRFGLTPGRYTELSAPGDPDSTSATPDQPPCGAADAGTDAGAEDGGAPDAAEAGDGAAVPDAGIDQEPGGCACRASPAGGAPRWPWPALLLLLALRRRLRPVQNKSGQSSWTRS